MNELEEVSGGWIPIALGAAAAAIGVYDAVSDFIEGWNEAEAKMPK